MTRYPLTWPDGQPRTRNRIPWKARDISFEGSREALIASLRLLRARDVILSTNARVRGDGYPYAGEAERMHADPGAAVYFKDASGHPRVIACDTYRTLTANIRAILHTVDALRTLARHGAAQLERAFVGFSALPPMSSVRPWWEILGVARDATNEALRSRWREIARQYHPDVGGDETAFKVVSEAWARASRERGIG